MGCYLSHLRAWEAFLAGGESHALICEDDLSFPADFPEVLRAALERGGDWDVLRLSGLRAGQPGAVLRQLPTGHRLCVTMARLKGAGAYLLNRRAAERLGRGLLPMRLPFDHALDREWFFGLRAACILPFPVSQTDGLFRTSIQAGSARRLGWKYRVFTTWPYQAANELSRYCARSWQYLTTPRTSAAAAGPA